MHFHGPGPILADAASTCMFTILIAAMTRGAVLPLTLATLGSRRQWRRRRLRIAISALGTLVVVALEAMIVAAAFVVESSASRWPTVVGCAAVGVAAPVACARHCCGAQAWIRHLEPPLRLSSSERDAAVRRWSLDIYLFGAAIFVPCSAVTSAFLASTSPAQLHQGGASTAFIGVVVASCAVALGATHTVTRGSLSTLLAAFRYLEEPTEPPARRTQRVNLILASSERRLSVYARRQARVRRGGYRRRCEQLLNAAHGDASPGSTAVQALVQASLTGDVGPIPPDPAFDLTAASLDGTVERATAVVALVGGIAGVARIIAARILR